MKRFVLAITLACALSATSLAGEVPTTGITPPPPPPEAPATLPGDVPSTDYESSPIAESDLLAALLSILNAAL
jgi:hypothetical protein